MSIRFYIRFTYVLGVVFTLSLFLFIRLEKPLFNDLLSTVLRDRDGGFLSGIIADDQQWRFPPCGKIPDKFEKAIINFEDKRFYSHPGVDPKAIIRAFYLNIKNKRVISGGSTLSMQVIRLSRKGKKRTIAEKFLEMVLAFKLELKYTKGEILKLYASYAPFGGNVVGLDAASWRYFGVEPYLLSWGETAALAVLPNCPGLIYPGRNTEPFKIKRDKLLSILNTQGIISDIELSLALDEPLPGKPFPLPREADHLLGRVIKEGHKGENVVSTIDRYIQKNTSQIVEIHQERLRNNHIYNSSVIVMEVDSGNILAYIGNSKPFGNNDKGADVDIAGSMRSPGSLLKPVLYGLSLDDGLIAPDTLLPDIPLFYNGFTPRNFSNDYAGAVKAGESLKRSLNIPFVTLLQEYNYSRFYFVLEKMGLEHPNPPDHYGLSMILGGSETSLWKMAGIYGSMGRSLNNYFRYPVKTPYSIQDYHPPVYLTEKKGEVTEYQSGGLISAGALYSTFNTMLELSRPGEDSAWDLYESALPIAWKTGTSFGFRDAWAIGMTRDHLVAVWVGNADGEGRTDLIGVKAAAPILFDVFKSLPDGSFFQIPHRDMAFGEICEKSGMLKGENCPVFSRKLVPEKAMGTGSCKYHILLHLNNDESYQVDSSVYPVSGMVHKPWFVLPPVQEWYYRQNNSAYSKVPPLLNRNIKSTVMQFIYPVPGSKIIVPRELDGESGSSVFEVAHRDERKTLYWHLDGIYIGSTIDFHKMGLSPETGQHEVTVVDNDGYEMTVNFEIVE